MPLTNDETQTMADRSAVMEMKLEQHTLSALQETLEEEQYSETEDQGNDNDIAYKDENVTIQHFENEEVDKSDLKLIEKLMEENSAVNFEEMNVETFVQSSESMETENHSSHFFKEEEASKPFEQPTEDKFYKSEDDNELGTVEYLQEVQEPLSEEGQSLPLLDEDLQTDETETDIYQQRTKAIISAEGTIVRVKSPSVSLRSPVEKVSLKRPLIQGPGQPKVVTKVIIQGSPNSGLSQPFRVIGGSSPGQPRSITLAQAQQMGLKLQQILPGGSGQKRMVVKKMPSGTSLLSPSKVPAKILPAPSPGRSTVTTLRGPVSLANLQTVKSGKTVASLSNSSPIRTVPVTAVRQSGVMTAVKAGSGGPQKVILRQGQIQGLKAGTILSPGAGQVIRIPQNSSAFQPIQIGKQVQYVRIVSTPGSTASSTVVSNTKAKILKGPLPPGAVKAIPIAPGPAPKPVLPKVAITSQGKRLIIPVSQSLPQMYLANDEDEDKPQHVTTVRQVKSPLSSSLKEIPSEGSMADLVQLSYGAEEQDKECHEDQYDKENIDSDGRCSTSPGRLLEANGMRLKKPCNCTRSQCLKLYCECFANGEFCFQCNCNNCYNNIDHEDERQKSIKSCLERNPSAFLPKIYQGENEEDERRHNKGCNCKRSNCLKNYCECYEAKITCSNHCKCLACRNTEEFLEKSRSGLLELADVAEENFMSEQKHEAQRLLGSSVQPGVKQPHTLMSAEVVEATCQCLLAQAEEAERSGREAEDTERLIIEEFGRCLVQIIGFSKKDEKSHSTVRTS